MLTLLATLIVLAVLAGITYRLSHSTAQRTVGSPGRVAARELRVAKASVQNAPDPRSAVARVGAVASQSIGGR